MSAPVISAGTQVVVRVPVYSSSDTLVHPRGAVGVITRTPAGAELNFTVRFPDGFESALPASDFEILKQFKERLGAPAPDGTFDLESLLIFRCVIGSRAYGLDAEDSDTDRRGIYLAPAELQWSLHGAPDQFEDNTAQTCYWEVQRFLVLALKANPNILECLYSPLVETVTPLGEALVAVRARFLSQMIFQTFNGYALSQFKKLEQDIRNQGTVRWKHAMHLLRLLLTGAATLRRAHVPVRIESAALRERLLAVKHGAVAWTAVEAWRAELHRDFERALAETKLPERPDYEAANNFLVRARRHAASVSPTPRPAGSAPG